MLLKNYREDADRGDSEVIIAVSYFILAICLSVALLFPLFSYIMTSQDNHKQDVPAYSKSVDSNL